ncbi:MULTISPECIES: low temperature requirement protein A [unclassified Leptolyngbya]|uniref:low temperature requirement protein A n=1 Tax=unclassified Leptolyngbya TaxID=2650499 RepID=UPI001685B68A|nr:low temperature requirement protein A [Leptolyngbya sp. FACHB-8]MBD2154031.1 low temperature requirement protein A [Leptolyngbya sp. FACHB-16]
MPHWFHAPKLRVGNGLEDESRRATWLELFLDLVFVVAVAQEAHYLSKHLSMMGFLGFLLLFLPLWWAWIGITFYSNRFDVDDVGHRLLTAVQMLFIAAMAVNIHDALGESSVGFALSYVAVRVVLVLQYIRAARHLPSARQLATHYATGFAIACAIWLFSLFFPIPYRFVFWVVGMAIDIATPLTGTRYQANLLPHLEHLPERFGLFVIIVLGEAIVAVTNGVSEQHWELLSVLTAIFGFSIAFSLWWIYFENVGGQALRDASRSGQLKIFQFWLYGHLPLVIGIPAAGVAVEHAIAHDPATTALPSEVRWLLCGAIACCMLALGLLHRTGIIFRCQVRARYRMAASMALLALAVFGYSLPPVLVVALVSLICIFQVFQDYYQGHPVATISVEEPQEKGTIS